MQLSDLIAAVRDDIQDFGQRFSDATITRQLNAGQLKAAMVSAKLYTWSTTVAAGTASEALPADLLIPKNAWFEQGGSNRYPVRIERGLPPEGSRATGSPTHIFINGNTAYYYPVPGQDITRIISGIKRPTPMASGTDTPDVEDVDDLIIAYAGYICLLNDGDPLAANKQQVYERERQEWSILDALKYPLPSNIDRG